MTFQLRAGFRPGRTAAPLCLGGRAWGKIWAQAPAACEPQGDFTLCPPSQEAPLPGWAGSPLTQLCMRAASPEGRPQGPEGHNEPGRGPEASCLPSWPRRPGVLTPGQGCPGAGAQTQPLPPSDFPFCLSHAPGWRRRPLLGLLLPLPKAQHSVLPLRQDRQLFPPDPPTAALLALKVEPIDRCKPVTSSLWTESHQLQPLPRPPARAGLPDTPWALLSLPVNCTSNSRIQLE